METLNRRISVVEPVEPAIEQVKRILFKPFDLGKWFIIGFCAWLAYFGHSSGGGFNGFSNFDNSHSQPSQVIGQVLQYCRDHIVLVGTLVFSFSIVFIAIALVLTWLSSRGQFMFLDCVVKNKAAVAQPWRNYKKQGNSLFLFRLVMWFIGMVSILPAIAMTVFFALSLKSADTIVLPILLIAAGATVIILIAMTIASIMMLAYDFVVPIMYLRKIGIMAAWKKFLPLFWQNFWKIALLYFLFKFVLAMAIGAIVCFLICLGCCCCCVSTVVFIPYIGTVVMLPILSFYRLYPLFYLRQYGTEFDVFAATT
ncbi:MAG: hypothetical protein WC770_08935 [Phycisphaerae bacterium]|jgi:hypothetical protein